MQNDIVKQIILKFKSEGSEQAKKAAESISKSFNPRETERFLRNLEQVQQKFGRTGQGLSAELKKVTDYFKELNNQHFQRAERNLDRLGRLIKNQIENIERLKREGGSAEEIAAREATLQRATRRFESLANETPVFRPDTFRGMISQMGGGGPNAMLLGGLKVAAAIVGAASAVAKAENQFRTQVIENRIQVANVLKQRGLDVFSGDLSKAVLYNTPGATDEIKKETRALRESYGRGIWADAILSPLVGATAGAISGGVVGSLPGAVIMGTLGAVAGLGRGIYKIGTHYFGGGKEAYAMQARELAEQKVASQALDLEYYKEFARNAEMRFNYQRQLQMGDEEALRARARFRAAGVLNEQEMAHSMLSFRRFGARTAPAIAAQTTEMAKQMGMDVGVAQQLVQSVAAVNRGGINSANKDLEELFRRAVATGVRDSGLIEEYQKAAVGIMQALGTRMSAAEIANEIDKFMLGGSDVRNIQAIQPAMQAFGATMKGVSPLMQTKGTAGLLDLARDEKGNVNMLAFQYLSQMTPQELATLNENDPVLKQTGISPEKVKEYKSRQIMGTLKSNLGATAGLTLLEKANQPGALLSEGEQRLLAVGFGMQNAASQDIRAVQSFLKANLQTLGAAGEGLAFEGPQGAVNLQTVQAMTPEEVQAEIARTTFGTAAGKQVQKTAEGMTEQDRRINERIEKRIDEILAVYIEQSKTVMQNLDQNILAGPIKGIADAADQIVEAMTNAANRIDGGNRVTTRASAKSAGEGE